MFHVESNDGTETETIGKLIVSALSSDIQSKHLCECWEIAFSEVSCPICLPIQSSNYLASDTSTRLASMLQSDPKLPNGIKSNNSINSLNLITCPVKAWPLEKEIDIGLHAAWIWRALLRIRGDTISDKSRLLNVPLGSDKIMDVHFPFDFHCVRHLFGGTDDILASLSKCSTVEPRGGKSNSKFVVTDDGRYLIKSLNSKEEEFLSDFAPAFFWYYSKAVFQGMPSLLAPLLGMFTLRTNKGENRNTFIVLNNLSQGPTSLLLDLKGAGSGRRVAGLGNLVQTEPNGSSIESGSPSSKLGGDVSSDEINFTGNGPTSPASGKEVLWDEDFRQLLDMEAIQMPPKNHEYFNIALLNDTEFLASMQVVDYSLFMSVQTETDLNGMYIIYAGIIDFLRPYTWDKKFESVVKSVNANIANLGSRMSVIANGGEQSPRTLPIPDMDKAPTIIKPDLYAKRFRNNIGAMFTACDDV